jgi:mono/diheme cytochrome c family protein
MKLAIATLVIAAALAAGCANEHRGQPEGPAIMPETPEDKVGQVLFDRFCYQCHPNGESGFGPALNDKPLPEIGIRTQIRVGVGSMPAFGEEVLTDEQVKAIASYVNTMRQMPDSMADVGD